MTPPKIQTEIDRLKSIPEKDSIDRTRLATLEQCKTWIKENEDYNNWIQNISEFVNKGENYGKSNDFKSSS